MPTLSRTSSAAKWCGIYDVGANAGYVSLGIAHDTAAFAVNAARLGLEKMERDRYPAAKQA